MRKSNYGVYELAQNIFYVVKSKILFPGSRMIRFPVVVRHCSIYVDPNFIAFNNVPGITMNIVENRKTCFKIVLEKPS